MSTSGHAAAGRRQFPTAHSKPGAAEAAPVADSVYGVPIIVPSTDYGNADKPQFCAGAKIAGAEARVSSPHPPLSAPT
jgi:hypothetical protein